MENVNDQREFEVAEIQLSYRPNLIPSLMPTISCSKDAEKIFRQCWALETLELVEQFKILLVNRAHKVLGIVHISQGGIVGTIADPKIIFGSALKAAATGIILAHNHPSGNIQPSQADINLTSKLKEGGRLLDIMILDHIILTSEKYFSFAQEGLL